jgi:hypothetical protein
MDMDTALAKDMEKDKETVYLGLCMRFGMGS